MNIFHLLTLLILTPTTLTSLVLVNQDKDHPQQPLLNVVAPAGPIQENLDAMGWGEWHDLDAGAQVHDQQINVANPGNDLVEENDVLPALIPIQHDNAGADNNDLEVSMPTLMMLLFLKLTQCLLIKDRF